MSDEIAVLDTGNGTAAPPPAPASDKAAPVETPKADATTATQPPAEDAGADEPDDGGDKPKKSGGVSKRIAELTRDKRTLERQVDQLMELARTGMTAGQPKPQQPIASAEPKQEHFASWDEYQRAVVRHEAMKLIAERDQGAARRQQEQDLVERREALKAKLNEADERFPDFEDVVADVPVTPAMQRFLELADDPRGLAFHLGKNPAEAKRIAKLEPDVAFRELARIEARIAAPPPPRKTTTNAPNPPKTIAGGGGTGNPDPSRMTMAEYMKWRDQGGGA